MSIKDLSIIDCLDDPQIEPALKDGFTLNDVLVLPARSVIVKNNQHYHLSRKAMDLLLILSSSAGNIVSKEVISEFLWGDKQKKQSKISGLVSEIRRLLDDRPENPVFVQTLPRKGYKLLVMALPLDENLLSADILRAAAESENSNKLSFLGDFNYLKNSRLFKVAGTYVVMSWVLMQVVSVSIPVIEIAQWFDKVMLLILIVGFPIVLWYNWYVEYKLRKKFISTRKKTWSKHRIHSHNFKDVSYISFFTLCSLVLAVFLSNQVVNAVLDGNKVNNSSAKTDVFNNVIAVMPFSYVGDNTNNTSASFFQSEILTFLSQSTSVRVVSERVLSAIPQNASLDTIKELTGAKYILEGRIAEYESDARITTTLIDTTSGHRLWTNRTKVAGTNTLSLVETISRQVYNAIIFLMPQEKNTVMNFKPTNDINAYDFYIRAKARLKDAYSTKDLKEAEDLFLQALTTDRKFELAQAGLCLTYLEQYRLLNQSQIFNLAKQACELSIDINGQRADPEIALARLYLGEGNYEKALLHLDKGLAIDPNNSLGLTVKARTLDSLGRYEQANNLFLSAIRVEPGYWRNFEEYGNFLFNHGQYEQASLQFYKQSLLQPNNEEAYNNLGAAHYLNNDYEKAIDSWRLSAAIQPSANTFSNLGTSMYFAKQFDNAVAMYKEAVKRNPDSYVLQGNLADAMKYASNMQAHSLATYQNALNLANLSDTINPNNADTKASIARYESELGSCNDATSGVQDVINMGLDDPYTYYELALVINNCGTEKEVLHYLEETLRLGYPRKLLLSDQQFDKFHVQIELIQH